jgi:hypothetical protein
VPSQKTPTYPFYYIYSLFLLRNRLEYLDQIVQSALRAGYTFLTVEEFSRYVRAKRPLPPLTFVLRNDVDTDPNTARLMFQCNRRHGFRSSYYFRLSTLDFDLMAEMATSGCEVSYHFEEIATYAKRMGSTSADDIMQGIDLIQAMFRDNISALRLRTGLKMQVVASHGDFVNRIIGVPNYALLDDALREELDLFAEAYDADLAKPVTARISDEMPPIYWRGGEPLAAVRERSPVIYLLIHPMQWRANIPVNVGYAAHRVWEGIAYALRRQLPRSRFHSLPGAKPLNHRPFRQLMDRFMTSNVQWHEAHGRTSSV